MFRLLKNILYNTVYFFINLLISTACQTLVLVLLYLTNITFFTLTNVLFSSQLTLIISCVLWGKVKHLLSIYWKTDYIWFTESVINFCWYIPSRNLLQVYCLGLERHMFLITRKILSTLSSEQLLYCDAWCLLK